MVMATSLLFGACNSKDIDIEVKVKAKKTGKCDRAFGY